MAPIRPLCSVVVAICSALTALLTICLAATGPASKLPSLAMPTRLQSPTFLRCPSGPSRLGCSTAPIPAILAESTRQLPVSGEQFDYPEYHLSSLADLTRRAGGRLSRIPAGQRPRPAEPTQSQKLLASLLPDSWDWRQVNGQSYVSPVRNQASCGSCYSFSSTGMLEARLKILTRNSVNYTLSEQDVVECSPYSQGCDGGFPYLIAGKYAEDYGMALEECNPYKGQDGVCRTKQPCRRLFATNYQYVGGYYGA
uniref:Pept_C1 domain-containing protein n=1 Tax=Macrostomum lignano TaxID=282301 RepID=A0A1I8IVI1_9PLAT